MAQLCRSIYSQLRHISTNGKKHVKQQYLLHMLHNMVKFGPLTAEIVGEFGAPQQISTGFASWLRYCNDAAQRLNSIQQRAPPIFGRAATTLGIGPHSSFYCRGEGVCYQCTFFSLEWKVVTIRPLMACLNEAIVANVSKTRNPLKFAGVPQTRQQISAVSRPKFTILSGHAF